MRMNWTTQVVPRGHGLSPEAFEFRHTLLLILLCLHIPAMLAFGVVRGYPFSHALVEMLPVMVMVCAQFLSKQQRWRSMWVTGGLAWCSAILVHFTGGQIEAHFHFFVVIGFIALYQRWLPFAWSIFFTIVSHGLGSALSPESMFNHAEGIARPWLWAGIHGVAVLCAAVAQVIFWAAAEGEHRRILGLSEELGQISAENHQQRRRFESLVRNAFDGVAILDGAGTVTWASPTMCALLGGESERSQPVHLRVDSRDSARLEKAIADCRRTGTPVDRIVVLAAGTERRWIALSLTNMMAEEAVGGIVVHAQNVTAERIAEDELAWQAGHDALTGLPNRSRLPALLARAVTDADETGNQVAIMFVDLDRFKQVNDGFGHAVGDALLVEVADRLTRGLAGHGHAARLSGDEFVVLCVLPSDPAQSRLLAESLSLSLRRPYLIGGDDVRITASIGIAYHREGEVINALLLEADRAMYAAKNHGRNRVEVFDPDRHIVAPIGRLEHELRAALEAGDLFVEYQPLYELHTHSIRSLEALARWRHAERGLISPVDFIVIAEESGLIVPLGEFVLLQACSDLMVWDPDGATQINVNVSGVQLLSPVFVDTVTATLDASGLAPARLTLELTETSVILNQNAVRTNILRLASLGVRFAMDDFGTGYSALVNLRRYPFDEVKIDKEFIARMTTDTADSEIVRAIIGMSHALGIETVGEGIEDPAQFAALQAMGCDLGQGYLMSRPKSVHALPHPDSAGQSASQQALAMAVSATH